MVHQWIADIDQLTKEFDDLLCSQDDAVFFWKPDHNLWTIAQILDHLILTNESYFPLLNDIRENLDTKSIIKDSHELLKNRAFLIEASNPNRKTKLKTAPIWTPRNFSMEHDSPNLDAFKAHQKRLIRNITASEDLISNDTVIHSPANHDIYYTVKTAFDVIVLHERRHLEQIKENLKHLNVV